MTQKYVHITLPMLKRARDLYGAGLSYEAIRRVLELDFGVAPSVSSLGHYLSPGSRRPHLATVGRGKTRSGP